MELQVYKKDGSLSGNKVKLPAHVFGIEPNEHVVYLAVKTQQANSRQGNAASKTRAMVSGGGRKPWKQKGRGAARAGSNRSPVWVGGGRVFGPHPRDYNMKLSKKVKNLARISAYSDKAKREKIKLIEDFKLDNPKTKELVLIFKSLDLYNEKILLLLNDYDADILRAGKNIPKLQIRVATFESTYDLLNCECVLMQEGVVKKISGAFKK